MLLTLVRHALRRAAPAWAVWTVCTAGLAAACVALWPQMESQTADLGAAFAGMGAFTAAFGLDRLDIGSFLGFYGVEAGNIVSLGGALYAAMAAAGALCGEERAGTAEWLLAHPAGRGRVLAAKALALAAQVLAFDALAFAACAGAAAAAVPAAPWGRLCGLHAAWALLHIQLAALCFGLSALRAAGPALGLGLAAGFYFLALVANLAPAARWLRFCTPFAWAGAGALLPSGPDWPLALPGLAFAALAAALGCRHYRRKDIV